MREKEFLIITFLVQHQRGKAIQAAIDRYTSPMMMVAIVNPEGIDANSVHESIRMSRNSVDTDMEFCCDVASINSKEQWVLSGFADSIRHTLERLQSQRVIRRSKTLQVGAPFHSTILKSSLAHYAESLSKIEFLRPTGTEKPPIISNVTGQELFSFNDINELKHLLLQHIVHTVQWKDSMTYALKHSPLLSTIIEIGPGSTLLGFLSSTRLPSHVKTL